MKILDVMWFSSRSCVGVVKVYDDYDGIKYFIGSPPMSDLSPYQEQVDKEWIADWGARFPKEVGDIMFGSDPLRDGSAVQIPLNVEQAKTMVAVGMSYLEK